MNEEFAAKGLPPIRHSFDVWHLIKVCKVMYYFGVTKCSTHFPQLELNKSCKMSFSPVLRIRCLFDPWIRDPGWVKKPDPDPGWAFCMIIFVLKYFNSLMWIPDPDWKYARSGIQDKHLGSETLLVTCLLSTRSLHSFYKHDYMFNFSL